MYRLEWKIKEDWIPLKKYSNLTKLKAEDEKFVSGNNAAGTRARKALQQVSKLVKARRTEITEEKNARKELIK